MINAKRPTATTLFVHFCSIGVVAVTIFLTLHPRVIEFFSQRFLGGTYGDGGLYVWLTQQFIHDPVGSLLFETNAFYPYPLSRAWSDSFLLPSAVAWCLVMVGVPLAAAYNAVLLVALGANAGATYLLARTLGVQPLFCVATAIVFANASYFLGNFGHPQLLFFFWIPLAWSSVFPQGKQVRAPTRAWFFAGLCVAASFYCAVYYAIFIVLGLGVIWFSELARRVASSRRALRTLLAACLGGLPLVYALDSYLSVQGYFGARGSYEAEAFAAKGSSYLSFTPFHDVYAKTAALSHSEAYLGIGYIALAMAVAGLLVSARKISPVWGMLGGISVALVYISSSIVDTANTSEWIVCVGTWAVLVCAVLGVRRVSAPQAVWLIIITLFVVLSFGPGGNSTKGEPAFSPLAVAYERMPGLSAIRAVGRFGSVVLLGIVIGAAQVAQSILRRKGIGENRVAMVCSAGLLCGVGLFENSVSTFPFDAPRAAPQAVNAYKQSSSSLGPVLFTPWSGALDEQGIPRWSEFAVIHTQYAQWSTASGGLKTVNGYSGQRSKIQAELARALRDFPSQRAFQAIGRLCGVRAVVISATTKEQAGGTAHEEEYNQFKDFVRNVTRYSDGSTLVQLATIELPLQSSEQAWLFAPRDSVATITVKPVTVSDCPVLVSSLTKTSDGRVQLINEQRFLIAHQQELRVAPPASLSSGSPHVVQVVPQGCDVSVWCDVKYP